MFSVVVEKDQAKTLKPRHRSQFGLAVSRRRQRLGLSQEQLAEVIDCHRTFVGKVERGEQNIAIDSEMKFARALKCSLADLFGDAGL